VRFDGRWYRAGHPEAGNFVESILTLGAGLFLLLLSAGLLSNQLSPEKGPVAEAAP
jgi:hypothetical protein